MRRRRIPATTRPALVSDRSDTAEPVDHVPLARQGDVVAASDGSALRDAHRSDGAPGGGSNFEQRSSRSGVPPLAPSVGPEMADPGITKKRGPGRPPGPTEATRTRIQGLASWDSLKQLARQDVDTFLEFVVRRRGEKGEVLPPTRRTSTKKGIGGIPLVQHRIHTEMQDAVSRDLHVVILGAPETGKTVQMVGRVLHELGNDTARQYLCLGNTQNAAKKSLTMVKQYIEESAELEAVFPKLRPGGLWTTEAITVDRESASRDPSVQTAGYHGDILGSRLDGILADDCLDFENTRNERARLEFDEWIRTTVLSRELDGAWCAFLTNAWHERDQVSRFEKDGWRILRYPVLDAHGAPMWAERYPLRRIEEIRRKMPRDFVRLYMCRPRSDEDKTFMPESVAVCREAGRGYGLIEETPEWLHDMPGMLIVTGVDLGASRKKKGGKTVLGTIAVHPNGQIQPIGCRSGRGGSNWLFDQMEDFAIRYGGVMVVEDNAIQKMIVEIAQQRGDDIPVPIVPFQTGRNKVLPETGIATMAAEMDASRWILPDDSGDGELEAFYADLDSYDPEAHTGDHLMAFWMARTYARKLMRKMRTRGAEIGARPVGGAAPRRSASELREAASFAKDPIERIRLAMEAHRAERRDVARAGAVTLEDLQVGT